MPVDVTRKPTQVHGRAAECRLVRVHVPGVLDVLCEQEALDDARFAGAVGTEDEGEWAQRDFLRGAEGFEVADFQSRNHGRSMAHEAGRCHRKSRGVSDQVVMFERLFSRQGLCLLFSSFALL